MFVNKGQIQHNEFVTVSVANTGNATSRQWVAVYSPANAEITETVPIKYAVPAQVEPSYLQTGRANISFQLPNLRSDYAFVFYDERFEGYDLELQGDWWAAGHEGAVAITSTAWSNGIVTFAKPDEPLQVRVVPADGANNYRIMWNSNVPAASPNSNHLKYGSETDNLLHSIVATTDTYSASDLCDAPANSFGFRDPGFIHSALVHVAPGLQIYYTVGAHGEDTRSAEMCFKPPPAVGPEVPVTIAAWGDLGRGTADDSLTWHEYGSPAIQTSRALAADAVQGRGIDAFFHIGDLGYAVGYAAIWDQYLMMIQPFASQRVYMINQGNHEYDQRPDAQWPEGQPRAKYSGRDSGGECGIPTMRQLPMPHGAGVSEQAESTNGGKNDGTAGLWWSRDIGSVHILAINTEVEFSRGSKQWRWIEEDLHSVDRRYSYTHDTILTMHTILTTIYSPYSLCSLYSPYSPLTILTTHHTHHSPYSPCRRTPWIVFGAHRPMYADSSGYSTGYGGNGDFQVMQAMQAELEPLLVEHRVTLCIYGHHHSVQRMCAMEKGMCKQRSTNSPQQMAVPSTADPLPRDFAVPPPGVEHVHIRPEYPVHMLVGTGGASFSHTFVNKRQRPHFLEALYFRFGYARIHADNSTHLRWEWVDSITGEIVDRMRIVQDVEWAAGGDVHKQVHLDADGGDEGEARQVQILSHGTKWLLFGVLLVLVLVLGIATTPVYTFCNVLVCVLF
jgi:hypothetical protein